MDKNVKKFIRCNFSDDDCIIAMIADFTVIGVENVRAFHIEQFEKRLPLLIKVFKEELEKEYDLNVNVIVEGIDNRGMSNGE